LLIAKLPIASFKTKPPPRRRPIKTRGLLLGRLCGLRCLGLAGIGLGIFPAEALDATGGINQLLLAGKERMAIRADFQVDGTLMR